MPIVIGIAGYSGAGKTSLIEALVPRLIARCWRVGVLKHDAHKLELDREGKDTARFFAAGATVVCAHDQTQRFVRGRHPAPSSLAEMQAGLPADLDVVLVEGHKDAPIPRLVLQHPQPRAPIEGPEVIATLPLGPQRLEEAERILVEAVGNAWRERPLGTAVFVGGESSRMGVPKTLLEFAGRPLVEHMVDTLRPLTDRIVLVGQGALPHHLHQQLPVLPDAPDAQGPLAGLLSLLRHDPTRAWLVVGCDQPEFGLAQARLLIDARRPAAWAVMAQLTGRDRPEPFGAIVEPALRPELEAAAARQRWALHALLARAPSVVVTPSETLGRGWQSVNTPKQWRALSGHDPGEPR